MLYDTMLLLSTNKGQLSQLGLSERQSRAARRASRASASSAGRVLTARMIFERSRPWNFNPLACISTAARLSCSAGGTRRFETARFWKGGHVADWPGLYAALDGNRIVAADREIV